MARYTTLALIADQICAIGIVPVIVIENAHDAVSLGKALLEGGLPCAEITFRTEAASEAIGRLREEFPDLLMGAGTVLTTDQAAKAIDAGARFIVAPGFNPRVVDYCLTREVEIFPGICTPTEIEAAIEKGLTNLKIFPIEHMGGLEYLKTISAPYSSVRYLPTGGIGPENVRKYLSFDKVFACAGTWMAKSEWIAAQRFDLIRERAWEAVQIVRETRGTKR